MRTLMLVLVALAWTLALTACGGKKGEEGATPAGGQAESAGEAHGHAGDESAPGEMSPAEMADSTAARLHFTYRTRHDPARVFTLADIPEEGGYLKLDFEGLDDATVNRILHRFMAEPATCEGCDGLTLDEVLHNLPGCAYCIIQARKILKEIRTGVAEG